MPWISVRGWRTFQHYDPAKRVPPWIKNHTDLMDNPDYLGLTEHCALLLHRLWLTYASARCQLPLNTATLSRQLGLRVMTRDLERLCDAGWIDIVASKTLAEGYHRASARARSRETEEERETDSAVSVGPNGAVPATEQQTEEDFEQDPEPRVTFNNLRDNISELRQAAP